MVNTIKPNSPASENDIRKKDIIVVIGKSIITNIDDYNSELDNYKIGDTIMLRILRDNNPFYLAFFTSIILASTLFEFLVLHGNKRKKVYNIKKKANTEYVLLLSNTNLFKIFSALSLSLFST